MPRVAHAVLSAVAAIVLAGCGDGGSLADERAEQARAAAVEAGLTPDVADFLALAARGRTATYTVTYEATGDAPALTIASRPPDRRVEIGAGDSATVQLTVDGESITCEPSTTDETTATCRKTDAFPEEIGTFASDALDELTDALAERLDDFTFAVEADSVAGTDARCLITTVRPGRERAELIATGRLCISPEGVLLLVDQGPDALRATSYAPRVADDAFRRPDDQDAA